MKAGRWRVEMHCHTLYSRDSLCSLEAFIRTCRKRGLDRAIVTDHNTVEGALRLAGMAPDLIIVGEEVMTDRGELLAYFVQETVPPFLSPAETIRRLREQGAFISVSHPFDRLRRGAWDEADLVEIIDQVDAIEVFNARCLFGEDNHKAAAFAGGRGKLGTVGSDSHMPYELGRAVMHLPPFEGAEQFAEALRQGEAHTRLSPAWVHGYSKYAKWMRKYAGIRMPNTEPAAWRESSA